MTSININTLKDDKFERSKRVQWFDLIKVRNTKVLVIGAGAIGNEVVKDLILSGFIKISVVDMDIIERSNLNRCIFFSNLSATMKEYKADVIKKEASKLDAEVQITSYVSKIEDLGDGFIKGFDIVMGCLDNIGARIYCNSHCYYNKVPYVDGATFGFSGKVQVVLPPKTPCLECGMNKSHMKVYNDRFSCTGREVTYYQSKFPAEITTTSVISAIMVREALKIASEQDEMCLKNIFHYNGETNWSEELELEISPICPQHINLTSTNDDRSS